MGLPNVVYVTEENNNGRYHLMASYNEAELAEREPAAVIVGAYRLVEKRRVTLVVQSEPVNGPEEGKRGHA